MTASRLRSEAISTRSQRSAAVTIARVPFVVDIASVGERTVEVLAGRVAEVEPLDQHAEALASERDSTSAASARASSTSAAHQTRSYPVASAWQIVDVARITSITTPVGAAADSSGVKAT